MADGFAATQGSGTTVATDDTAEGHVQFVKIMDGTLDSVAKVAGDATRGLATNPAKRIKRVQATPTITASGAYQSGDQLGGVMTIAAASRVSGGGGILLGVGVMCKANLAPTMVLRFYDQTIAVAADNAASVTSDGDRANQVGELVLAAGNWGTVEPGTPLNQFAQIPSTASASAIGLALPYTCAATSLFCSAQITSATTFASTTDLVFSFLFETD